MKLTAGSFRLFFFLSAFVSSAQATTFYVSPNGDDSADGSFTTPWRSIARVNSAALSPGDSVQFQGGGQFPGNLTIAASGVEVTSFATEAGDRAEILAGHGDGVLIVDAERVRFSKFKITGAGTGSNHGTGLKLYRSTPGPSRLSSIYIDQVEVGGFYWAGVEMSAHWAVPIAYTDVRLTNLNVHDNGYAGMWTGGCNWYMPDYQPGTYCFENVYVGYSEFHHNHGLDVDAQTGNGMFLNESTAPSSSIPKRTTTAP
jgi:hypothetical protein